MILDNIKNADTYSAIDPRIVKGLEFITQNADTIAQGKYHLDGEDLFVIVVETDLRGASEAPLEAHRQYIDVQVVLRGEESYGWAALKDCKNPQDVFDTEKDIVFFNDPPTTIVRATQGQFVVFFPEDAHAPLIGTGKVRKAVIKMKCRTTMKKKSMKISFDDHMELTAEQESAFKTLKKWRIETSSALDKPAFFIASDTELKSLVIANPQSTDELYQVRGFAKKRIERFGDDIIALLNSI